MSVEEERSGVTGYSPVGAERETPPGIQPALTHQCDRSMWTLQQEAGTRESMCLHRRTGEETRNPNVHKLLSPLKG
jgi:hypothetical protein